VVEHKALSSNKGRKEGRERGREEEDEKISFR
jgi:hypothetical protein